MNHLAADVARCPGVGSDKEGWREGCERCLRRTDMKTWKRIVWMEPPSIIAFWCEYLIDGEDKF